jgi:hypothetical protein
MGHLHWINEISKAEFKNVIVQEMKKGLRMYAAFQHLICLNWPYKSGPEKT